MKVRIKDTGEVIEVRYSCNGKFWCYDNPRGGTDYFQREEFFIVNDFDWRAFRNESASKAMQAIISNPQLIDAFDDTTFKWITQRAVILADELIAELRKPKSS